MVDTSPLLASLLLGQKRRVDPIEAQRAYGQKLITQGSSTAPLGSGSPLEGIARALQAGLGGLTAGAADAEEKAKGQKQIAALANIAGANNKDELTAAIKSSEIDPELAGPLMAQILQGKQAQFARNEAAGSFGAGFGGTGGTTSGPGTGGTTIDITPKPAPPGFSNNSGNIRSTAPGNYNGFATYDTPQQGAAAHFQNYQAYVKENPNITVGEAINKWSPASDNNNPNAIIARIQQEANIDPRTPLAAVLSNPEAAAKMLQTQTMIEKGGLPQGFTPQVFAQAVAPSGTPNPQAQGGPDVPPSTVQTPSAMSQPPEVPQPRLAPERIRQIQGMVSSGALTGEQAVQLAHKEISEQWAADRQRALAVWQDQQQSKRILETGEQRVRQEGPMTMIKDRVSNYETKIRPGAMAAVNDLASINQTRQVLDAGAFTGTGAEAKTLAAKVGEQLGIPSDQAQNTQVLGAVLAKRVLAGAGGTLGTGFSNADRDFMEKAQGGQITMDEGALRRLLDIGEKQSRQTLKNHDIEAGRLMKLPGVAQLGGEQFQLPQAPTYEEFNKANPLAPLQTGSAAPQGQAPQGGYSEGQTATNPQTKEKLIFRGGKWVPGG